MNLWILMLIGLLIAIALFSMFWIVQYLLDDSGIVDVGWGASVAAIGVFFCVMTEGNMARRWIGAILISVWAARLSFYLFQRWRRLPEDGRYVALKEKWGQQAQIRMFRFYQMQALGCYLFALPLLLAGSNEHALGWTDWLGIAIWVLSIAGEAIADYQLHQFRQDPNNKGEVCNYGLWRYSRHPNYFFEWFHWCSYVMLAITAPYGWLTILAPIAMWYFLTRVTGIPLTEIQAIKSRGDKYRNYQATTNAFFPWFPKTTVK